LIKIKYGTFVHSLYLTEERLERVLSLSTCDDVVDRLTRAVGEFIINKQLFLISNAF
jgi:hypothetical protein